MFIYKLDKTGNNIELCDDAEELLQFLGSNEIIAYDTETTGVNTRKDKIIGFGLSNNAQAFYIPLLMWNGSDLEEVNSLDRVKSLLQHLLSKKLVLWNTSFDIRMSRSNFNIDLGPAVWSDGMLAFHTINEEGVWYSQKPFGLKEVGQHFYGKGAVDAQTELKESIKNNGGGSNQFYKADLKLLAKYCMQDCLLTYKLNQKFVQEIETQGLSKFFFQDEVMPLLKNVTISMESHGLPLDLELLQKIRFELQLDILNLGTEIISDINPHLDEFNSWYLNKEYPPKRTGPFAQAAVELLVPDTLPRTETGAYSLAAKGVEALPPGLLKDWLQEKVYLPADTVLQVQNKLNGGKCNFNLSSKDHLKRLFFKKLGETAISFTEKGSPQVDEEFLELMAKKYDWAAKLIVHNKLIKIRGTYVDRFIEEQEDGIWYPNFFQHRTVSGRYGSDAQQLPRPLEEGSADPLVIKYTNIIRHFFKAKEGYTFIGSDYESLEPKVFSHVSTDPRLQEIFLKGLDFYSHIAIMTEGLEGVSADKKAPNYLGKVNKAKRQTAKPYSLGIPYGMTGYKLQFELGVSQEEADELVQNYLTAFPDLHSWMQNTAAKVYTQGYINVETGRRRRFPRAVQLYQQYGDAIFNDLELWKKYNKEPAVYEQAKKARREFKNYINNGSNIQIQGLAASIVNRACIEIAQKFRHENLSANIVLQIHDEIVAYASQEHAARAAQIMQEVMESAYKLSVPLVAEPCIAPTYGATK